MSSDSQRPAEKHFQEGSAELQIPQLPGFPVESCGFGQLQWFSLGRTTYVALERAVSGRWLRGNFS